MFGAKPFRDKFSAMLQEIVPSVSNSVRVENKDKYKGTRNAREIKSYMLEHDLAAVDE
jgi:hypothetical protein